MRVIFDFTFLSMVLSSPASIINTLGTGKARWERSTRTQSPKFFTGLRIQKLCCEIRCHQLRRLYVARLRLN